MHHCKKCEYARNTRYKRTHKDKVREITARFNNKRRASLNERLADWLQATNLPFRPISEDEWLQACSYFKGCALCGNQHVEARQFFIGFQHGGRYTSWNIFPACADCAKVSRRVPNPFIWLDKTVGSAYAYLPDFTEEREEQLLSYLMDQAIKERRKYES